MARNDGGVGGRNGPTSQAQDGGPMLYRDTCGKCGARRVDDQIGLEESPELYVAKLVEVFREVRRVLHPTGTCWINIGDSFWGGKGQSGYELPHEAEARRGRGETMQHAHNVPGYTNMRPTDGKHPVIKPKDLIGIPWMLAFALRADGWYLRSEIIWHKKAPMPESVTDRPTKAHEQLFLLAKSPTYYYDAEAIREPNVGTFNDFPSHARIGNGTGRPRYDPNGQAAAPSGHVGVNEAGRNKRSVWTLGPEQFPGSHFATMPTKLVEPCILAGTSAKGACAKCGSPWARVVEREGYNGAGRADATVYTGLAYKQPQSAPRGPKRNFGESSSTTLDWQPTCPCGADAGVVPCTVLDCFSGAATTGLVALKHGRKYLGLELNPDYIAMSHKRLLGVASQQRLFETP